MVGLGIIAAIALTVAYAYVCAVRSTRWIRPTMSRRVKRALGIKDFKTRSETLRQLINDQKRR